MILYLSAAFLRRLEMVWQPGFRAFLIGNKNLDFLTPDAFVPVNEITPPQIDNFLRTKNTDPWELLGWITADETEMLPGYISVRAGNEWNPDRWKATVQNLGESGPEVCPAEIQISSEYALLQGSE